MCPPLSIQFTGCAPRGVKIRQHTEPSERSGARGLLAPVGLSISEREEEGDTWELRSPLGELLSRGLTRLISSLRPGYRPFTLCTQDERVREDVPRFLNVLQAWEIAHDIT